MTDLIAELERTADISSCGLYRYRLGRTWDLAKPVVTYVMLNPSTADALKDDATIRSCMRLARSWDYGGICVVNLFAWRATEPKELAKADDPIGPRNNAAIREAAARSDFTICAWGAHKMAKGRVQNVLSLIRSEKQFAHCLGKTKAGSPKHPLYIKTGTMPELYP